MKIRNDFVSNSSSCSFIVKDVIKMFNLIFPFGQLPYGYDNLTVRGYCKIKDLRYLCGKFNKELYYQPYDTDENSVVDFYTGDYNTFRYYYDELDKKDRKKIIKFEFECEDYDNACKNLLYTLYKYFQLEDLNPDSTNTENSFESPGEEGFIFNLTTAFSEKQKEKK